MKSLQKLSICLIALFVWGGQMCVAQELKQTYQEPETEVSDNGGRKTLNDIRFDGWTKKEWADNEYIRAVRKYIDAYNNGEFEDPYLDEYKEYIQGKFVIYDISPFTWGGVLIEISFYDYPDKVFVAMVYSHVDDNRVVSNYECRSLTYEDIDLNITQEEIRQFLKDCPEQKMW